LRAPPGTGQQGDNTSGSVFVLLCRLTSRQPRSRRGTRACEARERGARRTLVACQGASGNALIRDRLPPHRSSSRSFLFYFLVFLPSIFFSMRRNESHRAASLFVRILYTNFGHFITTNHRIRAWVL